MKSYVAHDDVEQWAPLVEWLARPKPGSIVPPVAGGAPEPQAAAAAGADTGSQRALDAAMAELPPLPAAVANSEEQLSGGGVRSSARWGIHFPRGAYRA